MDCVASGMPFLFVYLDNNIVASSLDIQSHVKHLHLLFESLHDYGGNKQGDVQVRFAGFGFPGTQGVCHQCRPSPEEGGCSTGPPMPGQPEGASGFPGNGKFLPPVLPHCRQAPEVADRRVVGRQGGEEADCWTANMVGALTATKEALAKAALLAHPSLGV
jgi:hypothetical protein